MPAGDVASNGHADTLLINGWAYTGDAAGRWAGSLAISGGRILAVGAERDLRERVGSRTRVIDAGGGMILPGFQDAHVHPPSAGVGMARCALDGVNPLDPARARDEYAGIIERYARDHPGVPWILGDGWGMDAFPGGNPPKAMLDALVPDRPVYLESRDGHSAWVNSKALEMAGIGPGTAEPADGRIIFGEDGEPWGTLHEGACRLVDDLTPRTTEQEWVDGILRAQAYLHSLGITAWQDAIVEDDTAPAYLALAKQGRLTARVVGALWWDRRRGAEQVKELVERRQDYSFGRFRATSVKLMQDGIPENFTAGMLSPYLDGRGRPSETDGKSFIEPEALKRHVIALDAEGFQCHFHAIGDRAVRESLDAIEAARSANGWNDLRHHVAHIEIVHPDDVPRFRTVGAVANAQPLWACYDGQMEHLVVPFIGEERASWQYPFASLRRAGAVLAMGSDWGVSTPNPLLEMEVAVRRVSPDRRGHEPFYPHERIDLRTALGAFTMGSAYVNHLDDQTGSLEPGKLADLCVVDRDLFAVEDGLLGDAKVTLTLVDGRPVHADPAAVSW
ncbi:MAG TPA: amidohydrolase [Actinomycetota bacterium]